MSEMQQILDKALAWLGEAVLTTDTLMQLSASLAVLGIAIILSRRPKDWMQGLLVRRYTQEVLDRYNEEAIVGLIFPLIAVMLQWLLTLMVYAGGLPANVLEIIAKLLLAWIVIRLSTSVVRNPVWSKFVSILAWSIAALSITGMLTPTVETLDELALTVGSVRISILTLINGVIAFILLFWGVGVLSRLFERQMRKLPNITPSVRVLITKSVKIVLFAIAILIGLQTLGIDLTALTVFGGAIGLGLGFGLQKVVSNLFSGVILLLDRSVKPGDVIEVGGTYGWVNSLGARHVSVLTRDGVEHLIPNENLITEHVINWSYSSPNVRLKIPLSVAYHSDVEHVMALMEAAASNVARVLKDPAPAARLVNFGDSAIELELRVWIQDPQGGVVNVRSAILLEIWRSFKEHEIEIPFPQREVALKTAPSLEQMLDSLIDSKIESRQQQQVAKKSK